jgi:5'-phosphate synthase pdxT subunit
LVGGGGRPVRPVGVLALQGDVREHRAAFADLGVPTRLVRAPADLEDLSGIVLPGGESTTLSLLLSSSGVLEPLAARLGAGLPVFGTCAGMVLLAREVLDGRGDQRSFGLLDCTVRRNGYGRQRWSFESSVAAPKISAELGEEDRPMPAVFIRAPVVVAVGSGAEVLASLRPDVAADEDGGPVPVVCRQGPVLASAFHPELTGDRRLHRLFARMAAAHDT